MIQIFEEYHTCSVVLNPPLVDDDVNRLKELLDKVYKKWNIEFGHIYSINNDLISLLYEEKYEKNKNISIITHKDKLHRYLNKLGFNATFVSLIKDNVKNTENIKVVLIGGSADSSHKIIDIVSNISINNITIIIVQHVESGRIGIFDKILQEHSNHKVYYAKDGEKIQKNRIYLAPNNKHLKVKDGYFLLTDEDEYNFCRPSVSISYESFSSYYKESLMIVQECGYAKDGVDKLELIKRNKSMLIIQNKDECKAKSMVTHAIALNIHDYIFNQKNIVAYIDFINKEGTEEVYINYMLEMIHERYSYDFRLYHKDMIRRRLDVFMIKNNVKKLKDMVGAILFNKTIFRDFFLVVSINVTELFRNPVSFKNTKSFLSQSYKNAHNIKLWSAGCSSGKEVYSIAILLESLGFFKKSIIYATDFNKVILEEAKNGVYSNEFYESAKSNFSKAGLDDSIDRYISKNDKFMTIDEKIRQKILFFQHNLATDSSFNEFDIIMCKNVLIYFDNDLQYIVIKLFYDSLKFGGYLILGESEMIHMSFADKFQRYKNDSKIFKKVA